MRVLQRKLPSRCFKPLISKWIGGDNVPDQTLRQIIVVDLSLAIRTEIACYQLSFHNFTSSIVSIFSIFLPIPNRQQSEQESKGFLFLYQPLSLPYLKDASRPAHLQRRLSLRHRRKFARRTCGTQLEQIAYVLYLFHNSKGRSQCSLASNRNFCCLYTSA